MPEWTDLYCNSPETADAVKTYLDEQLRQDEDPPLVTAYVEKSTLRIQYEGCDHVCRNGIDMQLLGFRDGYDARAKFQQGQPQ
jgi:hypothetical protein